MNDLDKNMLEILPKLDELEIQYISWWHKGDWEWHKGDWEDGNFKLSMNEIALLKQSFVLKKAEKYIRFHKTKTGTKSCTIPTYHKLRDLICNGNNSSQTTVSNTSPKGQIRKKVKSQSNARGAEKKTQASI